MTLRPRLKFLLLLLVCAVAAGAWTAAERAEETVRRGVAFEMQRLELELRQLGSNPFLQAGAEVLDRSTVASALKTFCAAKELTACTAFDSDGDDLEGDTPGAKLAASEMLAAKRAARRLA